MGINEIGTLVSRTLILISDFGGPLTFLVSLAGQFHLCSEISEHLLDSLAQKSCTD